MLEANRHAAWTSMFAGRMCKPCGLRTITQRVIVLVDIVKWLSLFHQRFTQFMNQIDCCQLLRATAGCLRSTWPASGIGRSYHLAIGERCSPMPGGDRQVDQVARPTGRRVELFRRPRLSNSNPSVLTPTVLPIYRRYHAWYEERLFHVQYLCCQALPACESRG